MMNSQKGLLSTKLIHFVFLVTLYVAIVGTYLVYQRIQNLIEANASVAHTHAVIEKINSALLSVVDGERSEQAYLNTNNPKYLNDYNRNLKIASDSIQQAKQFTYDNPAQQERINQMIPMITSEISMLQDAITLYRLQGNQAALKLVLSNKNQSQLDKIKVLGRSIVSEEYFLLQDRNKNVFHDSRQTNFLVILVGSMTNFLLLVCFFMLNYQENRFLERQVRINAELTEKNRRIEKANQLKSEFMANMSHELRTPLNAIIGFTELMHNGEVGATTDEQKLYLHNVLTSAKDLSRLINDVLDLSKIESGTMQFHPEQIQLTPLVSEVINILQGSIEKKRIHLTTTIDPDIESVFIDPARFKQILYNYLSNAIKFTPELGAVSIHIKSENSSELRLEVKDNGIGIKPDELCKLFVEFQQLDSSTAKKYQGTGLGLSLTKHIAEAQGGQVSVQSEYGVGSTFLAVLPKDQKEAQL